MKRFLGIFAVLVGSTLVGGCSDLSDTLLPEVPEESGSPTAGPVGDIFDAQSGANPHFFFLNPFLKGRLKKNLLGTFDSTLEPAVTICPLGSWNQGTESCNTNEALAEYSSDPDFFGDQVILLLSSEKYQVVYKSQNYPMPQGVTHRVAVSIYGEALGWADMAVYDPSIPAHSPGPGNFTADDVLLLNGTENQNISFRIDEGALEAEFCDTANLEDCDVAIVDPALGTTLRVFEAEQALGALATIPAGILDPDGQPRTTPYPVVLELELDGNPQPGSIPDTRQVPYFADFWTPESGLFFDPDSPGVRIVVCQDLEGTGSIPEFLHDFLVIFLTLPGPSGPVTELLPTVPGAEECAGFGPDEHQVASNGEKEGLWSKFAASVSKVSQFILPRPLYAKRRLHGGLNTVVWEISPPEGEEGPEAISGIALAGSEPVLLQFGSVLNVDPEATSTAVTVPDGVVGEPTTIEIELLDALDQPFLFEVSVKVEIIGVTTDTVTAGFLGNGQYEVVYTPTAPGADTITFILEQEPYLPITPVGPYTSEVSPVGPSAANTTFSVSDSEEGSATTVFVTVLDVNGDPYLDGETFEIDVAVTVASGETIIQTILAVDDDGEGNFDGVYVASYTPDSYGSFDISVLIQGTATSDSPRTVTTAPRPADASLSEIQVGDGQVQSPTPVAVVVRNAADPSEPYSYGDIRPITVEVTVSGANSTTFPVTDPDLDGTYEGSYTPLNPGDDFIDATISDATDDTVDDIGVPQATSNVAPLSGPLTVQVQIAGPASAYVYDLPVRLYDGTGSAVGEDVLTDAGGIATFSAVPFGSQYTVHLPKRDFDVQFPSYAQTVDFDQTSQPVEFNATSQAIPASVLVFRIGEGGNGNAFEYTVGGRSWTSANNQVRDYFLLGVDGHLATLTSEEENTFVASIFNEFDDLCPGVTNPRQCKFKGWIGLSDEAVEGEYQWTTTETYDLAGFTGWPGGSEPEDRRGNEDYVEINLLGEWSITNGASTTNEGYFTEWEVTWPNPPGF